jgi:phosphoglycerate dehydrogenase-like enzyme
MIARPMARQAQAFGMKTLYWDVRRFPELEVAYGIEYVAWDDLFRCSDVLSVQIPIMPETHKIIGAREIGLMKPTALFVNTARGRLVDQPALVEALSQRKIGGAALDVFYEEPLPPDDPLHDLHQDLSYNVTLTSHSAWQGHWTHVRDSLGIWHNVLRVLRGESIEHQVG